MTAGSCDRRSWVFSFCIIVVTGPLPGHSAPAKTADLMDERAHVGTL